GGDSDCLLHHVAAGVRAGGGAGDRDGGRHRHAGGDGGGAGRGAPPRGGGARAGGGPAWGGGRRGGVLGPAWGGGGAAGTGRGGRRKEAPGKAGRVFVDSPSCRPYLVSVRGSSPCGSYGTIRTECRFHYPTSTTFRRTAALSPPQGRRAATVRPGATEGRP